MAGQARYFFFFYIHDALTGVREVVGFFIFFINFFLLIFTFTIDQSF